MTCSGVVLDLYGGGAGTDQWLDHSVHGNDGTLSDIKMRKRLANNLEVMEFVAADSESVNCGNDNSLAFTKAGTLMVWANATVVGAGYDEIFGKSNPGQFHLYRSWVGSTIWYGLECKVGGAFGGVAANTDKSINTWVFVVGTFDSSLGSNETKIYFNGTLATEASQAGDLDDNSAIDMIVGGMAGRYSDSLIWRPRALTRPLSQPQIGEIYNQEEPWFR